MFFDIVIEQPIATLSWQFNLFLDVKQFFVNGVDLKTPLKWILTSLKNLILLSLFEKQFLLLHQRWVKESDFSLFDAAYHTLTTQKVRIAWTPVL